MFRLCNLSRTKDDQALVIDHFPCSLGRSPTDDIRLNGTGIWEGHCRIALDSLGRISLECRPDATTLVNGKSTTSSPLKLGDELTIGDLKFQLEFVPPIPCSLKPKETAFWMTLAIISLSQVIMIYWIG